MKEKHYFNEQCFDQDVGVLFNDYPLPLQEVTSSRRSYPLWGVIKFKDNPVAVAVLHSIYIVSGYYKTDN